jgi:hypothetical protein
MTGDGSVDTGSLLHALAESAATVTAMSLTWLLGDIRSRCALRWRNTRDIRSAKSRLISSGFANV